MTMMDAALTREMTDHFSGQHQPFVADHHRPHSGVLSDEQRTAAVDRVKAYDKRISDAWKNPPAMFDGSVRLAKKPDDTTPDANKKFPDLAKKFEGKFHLRLMGDIDAATLEAIQADNQANYNKRLENAWRNPINHATGAK
jgi:hypothetical protein